MTILLNDRVQAQSNALATDPRNKPMPKQATLAFLRKMGACSDARDWFAETYPHGIDPATALAECPNNEWVAWMVVRLRPGLSWIFAGVAFRHAAKIHPMLAQYADNITPENYQEARRAAAYAAAAAARQKARKECWAELRAICIVALCPATFAV